MTRFDRAFQKLADLTNYERKRPDVPYRFDLAGMEGLLERLGSPERGLGKIVQVGGSKGKGTVAALFAGLCHRSGATTGVYASPHVRDLTERILLRGTPVPRERLLPHVERVADVLAEGQTWFEAWTAVAVLVFAQDQPDFCIFEVGLGGRLDSTTVLPHDACCLTRVELEHTQVLGDTIAEIAREKIGILRSGKACVTGFQGMALDLLEAKALQLDVPLEILGRDFGFEILERSDQGFRLRLEFVESHGIEADVPLHAEVQVESLVLAMALLRQVDPPRFAQILDLEFGRGLQESLPPARFQVVGIDPPLVIDGAHTDQSLELLARDLEAAFPGRRFSLVLGMAAGKQYRAGLGRLASLVDRAWVAPITGKPSLSPRELMDFLLEQGVRTEQSPGIGEAVRSARQEQAGTMQGSEHPVAGRSGRPGLLVTGSLYAAGEALGVLERE